MEGSLSDRYDQRRTRTRPSWSSATDVALHGRHVAEPTPVPQQQVDVGRPRRDLAVGRVGDAAARSPAVGTDGDGPGVAGVGGPQHQPAGYLVAQLARSGGEAEQHLLDAVGGPGRVDLGEGRGRLLRADPVDGRLAELAPGPERPVAATRPEGT